MCRIKNLFLASQVLLISFYSCTNKSKNIFDPETDPLYTITEPILLKQTENIIELDKLIENFENIDSIYYSPGDFIYNPTKKTLTITTDFENLYALSSVNIVIANKTYSIVCRKSNKTNIKIYFIPKLGEKIADVKIAGDFNDWNPDSTSMQYINGCWETNLTLDRGDYQYQLVVDSVWKNNYPEGDTVSNGIGGYNTLLLAKNNCSSITPQLFTSNYNEHEITIETEYIPDKLFILWQNQFIPIDLNKLKDNRYIIQIPDEAKKLERSSIRVYSSYKGCQSNDLLIPLKNGKVITSTKELSRDDKHYNISYFMLIDRFFYNCKENDKPINDNQLTNRANYQLVNLQEINSKLETGCFENLNTEEKETLEIFEKTTLIRNENIEFLYGSTTIIFESKNSLILKRQYFDNASYLLINQSENTKGLTLNKNELGSINDYSINFNSEINELSSNYQIMLAPYSFEVLTKK